MRARFLAGVLACLPATLFAASAEPEPPRPRVAAIEIVAYEVFDEPSEGFVAPYRVANRIHVSTRESVIERELLFATGDTLDLERLQQTERNLRALPFLRDARVETAPVDEDGDGHAEGVNVRVVTWDTWSLAPQIDYQRLGDRTLWEVGVSEKNLLGLGKQVTASRGETLDRAATRLLYRDYQLAGSRFRLTASVADLTDGDEEFLALDRPFFSLSDKWAVALRAGAFSRRDHLFDAGEDVGQLPHRGQWADLEFARAVLRRPTRALRLHVAYRAREEHVGGEGRDFGIVEVGVRSVEHRFVRLTHVNRFERTEDFNLGAESFGTFGISTPAIGGQEGNVLFLSAGHRRGLSLGPGHFLIGSVGVAARHEQARWLNGLVDTRLHYLRKHSTRHALMGKVEFRHGHNLDPEVQLLLGAESGLRGYPVRRFAGTRSLLLSAEERWFVADDLDQLLSVGVAAFVDSGFAWPAGRSIDLSDLKTAAGASLLLGSNRLSTRPGVRFDAAYALDPVTNTGRWVFALGSEIEF